MKITAYQGSNIDAVKILALKSLQFASETPAEADILKIGKNYRHQVLAQGICEPEQVVKAVRLWNDLPPNHQANCHLPGFALQFIIQDEAVFTAALCWQCNNICIGGRLAETGWRVFDSRSASAVQLLQLCGEVTGYTV